MSGLAQRIGKRQPFSSLQEEAYLNLILTREILSAPFERLFRAVDLSESTYNILRILRGTHPEPLPVLEIRRRMVSRVPDITRLLDRLEKLELVKRVRCGEDRRIFYCHITDAGFARIAPLDAQLTGQHATQLSHLAPEELRALSDLLEKARGPWDPEQQQLATDGAPMNTDKIKERMQ